MTPTRPSTPHASYRQHPASGDFACAEKGCKCRGFFYIFAEGAFILRCRYVFVCLCIWVCGCGWECDGSLQLHDRDGHTPSSRCLLLPIRPSNLTKPVTPFTRSPSCKHKAQEHDAGAAPYTCARAGCKCAAFDR